MEQPNNFDRVKELSEKLQQGVREVFGGGKYAEYLSTMSRFHHYSHRNSIAIHLQNPRATHVAGFSTWKNLGRSFNKGEKGLQILAPAPYKKTIETLHDEDGKLLPEPRQKEITCTAFKIAYVFDVSQTNGKELPRLTHQLTGEVGEYNRMMQALKNISPYPIEFEKIEGGANGYCDYQAQRIAVREGVSHEQAIKTGIHEIAHAVMHQPDWRDRPRDRQAIEVQAESVAYIVCQHLGIDSSQYSFGYVAGWGSQEQAVQSFTQNLLTQDATEFQWLKDRLEEIGEVKPLFSDAAEQLIEGINKHFKQCQLGAIVQDSPAYPSCHHRTTESTPTAFDQGKTGRC